jgi:2,4-dienoyl-CoA reductase-like NADH-dependent reductase (Old Yellow Enzyme family)
MDTHVRFNLETIDDLRAELDRLDLDLPLDEDLSCLGDAVRIGPHSMANRFAVHPMEGFDADREGTPGPLALRRYRRYAAGGSALIWFEATAVLPEGRSNPHQFWLHDRNVDAYARLLEHARQTAQETYGRDVVAILQLTHSGRYSKPEGLPRPVVAHRSALLDPQHELPEDYPVVTDEALDRLQEDFVHAARLAAQAGFDGVDVKACHRYLVSELLASHAREGRYGGSYENRTRFLREVLGRIRAEVEGLFVTTRMNAADVVPYPWGWGMSADDPEAIDLAEPLRLAGELVGLGAPVLSISMGNPYYNPHVGRPYDRPTRGGYLPEEHPLVGVARFNATTRAFQQALGDVPVVGGGYAWLRHLLPQAAAGVVRRGDAALIGQGRGAFAYPDSVRDILERGRMLQGRVCVNCSACTQIMRDGGRTGCLVRDAEVYAPEFREAREAARRRHGAEGGGG